MNLNSHVKLDRGILLSSLWRQAPEYTKVFITLLCLSNNRGEVFASVVAIADQARIPGDVTRKIMEAFMSPDTDSRTETNDGRRISKIPGGWKLINYELYLDRYSADDKREYRRVKRADHHPVQDQPAKPQVAKSVDLEAHRSKPLDGRLLDEIPCPTCYMAGYLIQVMGRSGHPPGFWCRKPPGCGANYPLATDAILSQMTSGGRSSVERLVKDLSLVAAPKKETANEARQRIGRESVRAAFRGGVQ